MAVQTIIQLPGNYPIKNSPYNGKRIGKRTPYIVQADLVLPANTSARSFAQGSFEHNQDYPFECLTMVANVTALDSASVPIIDPSIGDLKRYVQLSMKLIGSARDMTKFNTRLSALFPQDTNTPKGWLDFASPMYFEKSQGFDISVSNTILTASASNIRMEIGFLGSMLEFEG